MMQPTWPGTKMSSSGSTPNLLSATSLSTPGAAAALAHQHWSSTTGLPMSHRPVPPPPDQHGPTADRTAGVDAKPMSFVRQSLQTPGLSPPRPNVRHTVTADGLPAYDRAVSK